MSTAIDPAAVRPGRVRGRYFRENFAQGGFDLVQVVPELVTNADAAVTAAGRGHGRIVLAFGPPDPAFLADWRRELRRLRVPGFPVWRQEAVDAATALRARGFGKVGVVGWSMGGGVALGSAELPAHPFAAVAGFSTGGFGEAQTSLRSLPPTILLSGGPHDAIPASDTRALYRAIRAAGVTSSFYVYGNGSHGWPGAQGSAGIAKAAAFLRAHLR